MILAEVPSMLEDGVRSFFSSLGCRRSVSVSRSFIEIFEVHFTAIVCCGKTQGCGIYLIIQHVINIVFSIILIVFTSRFIQDPCLCYGELCSIPPWEDWANLNDPNSLVYRCTSRTLEKVPILKALLACAILILCISVAFILAYLIALLIGRSGRRTNTNPSTINYHSQPVAVQTKYPPIQQRPPLASPTQQQSYKGQDKVETNNYETVTEYF